MPCLTTDKYSTAKIPFGCRTFSKKFMKSTGEIKGDINFKQNNGLARSKLNIVWPDVRRKIFT